MKRRKFIGAALLGLAGLLSGCGLTKPKDRHPAYQPGEVKDVINYVEDKYEVQLPDPSTKYPTANYPHNSLWRLPEIRILRTTFDELPSTYFNHAHAPEVVLVYKQGSSGSAGGGYDPKIGYLLIFLPENFDPNVTFPDNSIAQAYYKTEGKHLEAVIAHEMTHGIDESNFPYLLIDWCNATCWQRQNGSWTNSCPQDMLHDGGADKDPVEDIAVSASLYVVNPSVLSQSRFQFLKNDPRLFNGRSY